jgi:hypothetical protein
LKKSMTISPTTLGLYALNATLFGGLCVASLMKWHYKGDSYYRDMGYVYGLIACIWQYSVWSWARKMSPAKRVDEGTNQAEHSEPV